MTGWAWSGSSSGADHRWGASGCGISGNQSTALISAEAWLLRHPASTVVFGAVSIRNGGDILEALRSPYGTRLVGESRAGRLTWQAYTAVELAAKR